jgi:hypothetical protein
MTSDTIPSFSRIEITLRKKADLVAAATELRLLAAELDFISAADAHDDETATIIAHHKIRAVSSKLRAGSA